MTTLFLDLETYSTVPIRCGTYKYSEGVEIMLWAYAIDDGPIKVWDVTESDVMPPDLVRAFHKDDVIIYAHNAQFDRTMLEKCGYASRLERWRCSMAQAYAHSLPGSLGALCTVFKLPEDQSKDKEGKKLIQLFCMPRKTGKIERATRLTHPLEWKRFVEYASLDIASMRHIVKKMPKWNYTGAELGRWHLDQRINARGFQVDEALAKGAIRAAHRASMQLSDRTETITYGDVKSTTQRDETLRHIAEAYGVELPDLTAATIERRLEDPELPEQLKELLGIRLQASRASVAKYRKLLDCMSSDGRMRGTLQYCAAGRTGRWGGRLFQPQNMLRPTLKPDDIAFGIEAILADGEDFFYEDVMKLLANAVRGCIIASPGKKLCVSDLSSIEGRVLPWLAGEQWKLDAYQRYDTFKLDAKGEPIPDGKGDFLREGPDTYIQTVARAFNLDPKTIEKKDPRRQIGKVLELACFGRHTSVLTNNGVKGITEVSETDLLWDGVEWVKHGGLAVKKGRPVVNIAGVEVTPDHLILTGKTWRPAWQLVLSGRLRRLALVTGSANSPLPVIALARLAESCRYKLGALAELLHITSSIIICGKVALHVVGSALKNKLAIGLKDIGNMLMRWWKTHIEFVFLTVYEQLSIGVRIRTMPLMQTMEREESQYVLNGKKIVVRFYSMFVRLLGGIIPFSKWIVKIPIKDTSRATSVLLQKPLIIAIAERFKFFKNVFLNSKPVYDLVNAGPRNRFTVVTEQGLLTVHNCGYAGGVGAFLAMASAYKMNLDAMAEACWPTIADDVIEEATKWWHESLKRELRGTGTTYGLEEKTFIVCDSLKRLWRRAHPRVERFWDDLEEAFKSAVRTEGVTYSVGPTGLAFKRQGTWLRCILPSGRSICYVAPRIMEEVDKDATADTGKVTTRQYLSYLGQCQYTRMFRRLRTYGGKLAENITQAVSRDIMAENMTEIETAGYEILLTVHDEIISEAADTPAYSCKKLSELLAINPIWADNLPLGAGGFEAYRYRKGD